MINTCGQNVKVTFLQENADPSLILVTNLPNVSEQPQGAHICVTFSINDVADFFINVKMLIVEHLQGVVISNSVRAFG